MDARGHMRFSAKQWQRLTVGGSGSPPVWLREDPPVWFVPNAAGDTILKRMGLGKLPTPEELVFLERLPDPASKNYAGRGNLLSLDGLRELWFHITETCNLTCQHCLFGAGPGRGNTLAGKRILELAKEAVELGCRVFALTGGEPFLHPEIHSILKGLFAFGPDVHVVVLTNGMLLSKKLKGIMADLPLERLHLQISVDGIGETHDRIRGEGSFAALGLEMDWLSQACIPFTIAMCVDRMNAAEMAAMVSYAAHKGASNLHYLWYFVRGRGGDDRFLPPDDIFPYFKAAAREAESANIPIDNLTALETQVFAPPGTIHDGSTAGWESLAVGPDGMLYPSAALVGISDLAVSLSDGLATAWKTAPVLAAIRNASAASLSDPMRYLTGGGDLDHRYLATGSFTGKDPYLPLLEKMALWAIGKEACRFPETDGPALRLRMGDILRSCGAHGDVAMIHPNCLLAVSGEDAATTVKSFYTRAAETENTDILNPVCYPEETISHIPESARVRGYGCGSPVADAGISPGDTVCDLGSGRGIECFIAAKETGPDGSVIGVDMLDPMLAIANETKGAVAENLGYANVTFRKGFLEALPLATDSCDVILSNCVMNLSVNKRKSFAEVFRVLRPGGRLVISDVVCDAEPSAVIRNDETLQGECIAGALSQRDLMGILEETGFGPIHLIRRFPYREVAGHPFFSLTYTAMKPDPMGDAVPVIYRGPFSCATTLSGEILKPGRVVDLPFAEAERLGDAVFRLDEKGGVSNFSFENTCCCSVPPEAGVRPTPVLSSEKMASGCMVCGDDLVYHRDTVTAFCTYCGAAQETQTVCMNGHFVCDLCHAADALSVMRHILSESKEQDMVALFDLVRQHPSVPVHGPEHHSLVPAVMVTAYRNSGFFDCDLLTPAIHRGAGVPGGNCGFSGVCGTASGVGIGISLILEASPITPKERQMAQKAASRVLTALSRFEAARCCQRDGWTALKIASELSKEMTGVYLPAEAPLLCTQQKQNSECMGKGCPLMTGGREWNENASY